MRGLGHISIDRPMKCGRLLTNIKASREPLNPGEQVTNLLLKPRLGKRQHSVIADGGEALVIKGPRATTSEDVPCAPCGQRVSLQQLISDQTVNHSTRNHRSLQVATIHLLLPPSLPTNYRLLIPTRAPPPHASASRRSLHRHPRDGTSLPPRVPEHKSPSSTLRICPFLPHRPFHLYNPASLHPCNLPLCTHHHTPRLARQKLPCRGSSC